MKTTNRMIRIAQVQEQTGLPRSTIYDLIADGRFPKQVKLSERCSAWVESEIQDWISERIAAHAA